MYNIIGSKIIIEYIYGHLYISGSSFAFNTFRSSSLPNHYFLLWKLQSAFFFFLLKSNISDSGLGGSTQLQLQEVPRSCESCHGKKHKGYCGFQLNFSYHTLAEFCPVTAVCQFLVYTDRIY